MLRKLLRVLLILTCAFAWSSYGDVVCVGTANSCSGAGGSGTVTGPGAACTDNALPRWDGATTTALQCSDIIVTDGEAITGVTSVTSTALVGTTSNCGGAAAAAANSVCLSANTITGEGATANAFQTLFAFGDATADNGLTITGTATAVTVAPTTGGISLVTDTTTIGAGTTGTVSLNFNGLSNDYRIDGGGANSLRLLNAAGSAWEAFTAETFGAISTGKYCWSSAANPEAPDTCFVRASAAKAKLADGTTGFGILQVAGIEVDKTITAGGTTGDQTINKALGTVNFAALATAITVTNSIVTTSSIIFTSIRTADATCTNVKSAVPGAGSFVITLDAGCTAETSVGFEVKN